MIYGLSEALQGSDGRPIIVVEGPFKVFHLYQAGFTSTVATFGASVSDEQIDILATTGRPLILMFDGDEPGQTGMRSAAERLVSRTAHLSSVGANDQTRGGTAPGRPLPHRPGEHSLIDTTAPDSGPVFFTLASAAQATRVSLSGAQDCGPPPREECLVSAPIAALGAPP